MMNSYITDKNAPRILGAMFLFVIFSSLLSGLPLASAVGSGNISDMLVNISNNLTMMHISILGGMVNSAAIVILAGLLYIVLSRQDRNLALIALGLWLAEAIFYAIIQLGLLALIPLSQDFVAAGAPAQSFYQALGGLLYYNIYDQGMTIHMWFYCVGGLIWYYLFYRSRNIPRAIPLFGLLAVSLALVGIVLQFFGYTVPIWVSIPILPFELAIGAWLLLKGIRDQPVAAGSGQDAEVIEQDAKK